MGSDRTGAVAPAPYRVPAPDPAARVVWPDSFGTRFTVFVDTEEEFDWRAPLRRDGHGTGHVRALPEAHRRFAERGAPLTYLVDWPIVDDPHAVAVLRGLLEDGVSAVGTQLHPWVNPPFDEAATPVNSYVGNLPPALEAEKLRRLTAAITIAFGAHPLVYRAGRYGIGPHSFALLAELGYRIDSSMRAWYDYSADGGPDFTAIGPHAFRTGPDGAIVELPFTTMFRGRLRAFGARGHALAGAVPRGRGVASRLGLLSRVSLTPEDMPIGEALEAVRIAVGDGVRVLNFAFHSPSLEPGHTPYVRDAADLAAFHRWWDAMLAELARLSVAPASLADLLAACDAAG